MSATADFRSLKLQKLDTIIRSLAERSQALDGMLDSTDAAGKHIIVLEQQVCESIAQDLAALMQQVSMGEQQRGSLPTAVPAAPAAPATAPAQIAPAKRMHQQSQPSYAAGGASSAHELGWSKAKADREKRKQNPAHREKEKARKAANMQRKIAERKAQASQETAQ